MFGPHSRALEIIGYLPEYRANRVATIPFEKVDRVILFSAEAAEDGRLRVPDHLQSMLKDVKARVTDGKRLSLAIGGWGRSQGIAIASVDAAKRARFVGELTKFCRDEKLGGADIDWEFPRTADEKRAFDLLLTELHAAFAPHGLRLSVAIGSSQVLTRAAVEAVDHIHLMSYDYGTPNHSPMDGSQQSVERLLRAGVPAKKIFLGVPFYGRRLTNHHEEIPYDRLLASIPAPAMDADEAGGYGFNGPVTLQRKLAYARTRGLGGAMIWELGQDAAGERSLLTALSQERARAFSPVGPVPDQVRRDFKLSAFHQKHIDLDGFPVLGSTNVSDHAMLEAAWIIRQMLTNRTNLLRAMAAKRARLVVMAHNEYTTDVPEHADLVPKVYWDRRARGLGGRDASCAEENLLCFPGDPYSTENILVHEFAHAIHDVGMKTLDPTFDRRLRDAYHSATNAGLWRKTYAATSRQEYWAESVQDWFDNNRQNDALHNHVATRAALKEYDPKAAALCAEVFGEIPWRYRKPADRAAADRAHLAGYDPSKAPRFQWRDAAVPARPRVSIETSLGEIELELDARRAPHTVSNFLRYVQAGLYSDGVFHRTVTLSNQPANKVKIQVIQASANPAKTNDYFPPIKLERTRDTGLKHLDGTLSMARDGVDSGQDHFVICIGNQPELDFGGKRNPDGQGFAAFGKVVKGMDVVKKIQSSPAEEQLLSPPVKIQRAVRLN